MYEEKQVAREQPYDSRPETESKNTAELAVNAAGILAQCPDSIAEATKFRSTEDSAMALGEKLAAETRFLFTQEDTGRLNMRPEIRKALEDAAIKVRNSTYPHLPMVNLLFKDKNPQPTKSQRTKIATFAACEIALNCSPTEALQTNASDFANEKNLSRAESLLRLIRREMPKALPAKTRPAQAKRRSIILGGRPIEDHKELFDGIDNPVRSDEGRTLVIQFHDNSCYLVSELYPASDEKVIQKLRKVIEENISE